MDMTLVIMAAGMGSRYGGLKQIEPVGKNGEIIMEYAVCDAVRAGFNHVVFVLKEEMLADFRAVAGDRIARHVDVRYVFQKPEYLPAGFSVPEGRVKPWGTGHALLTAASAVEGAFCVVNADDFYGADAFAKVGAFLQSHDGDRKPLPCCMAGYAVENTLTENGTVSRGVCTADKSGTLTSIVERTKLRRDGNSVTDDDSGVSVALGTPVSLNLWGFPLRGAGQSGKRLRGVPEGNMANPVKDEFYLPAYVQSLIGSGAAEVSVLPTDAKWYGVTYHSDRQTLVDAVAAMTDRGDYPSPLFA
jgi:hypothetical protein